MTVKTKKVKSAGRFGARYGRSVRARVVKIESKQRVKQKCPFCAKVGLKRLGSGIWSCNRCNKTFASDAYYLEE
jgi:large subunit ribosomal protein L37Ae